MIKLYAIVDRDGNLKKSSGGYALHSQLKRAIYWAKGDGDSVVEVEISLAKEPLFIRKRGL
jgi:hypothetical protein